MYDFAQDSLSFELPQICDISEKLYYVNSKIPRISIFTKSENLHRKQWNSNFFAAPPLFGVKTKNLIQHKTKST